MFEFYFKFSFSSVCIKVWGWILDNSFVKRTSFLQNFEEGRKIDGLLLETSKFLNEFWFFFKFLTLKQINSLLFDNNLAKKHGRTALKLALFKTPIKMGYKHFQILLSPIVHIKSCTHTFSSLNKKFHAVNGYD